MWALHALMAQTSGNTSVAAAAGRLGKGGMCDPTAGTIRNGTTVYSASDFTSCMTATGSFDDPKYGAGAAQAFSGTMCDAGFQCMPTKSDCSEGLCQACKYGELCPYGTSNRFSTAGYNTCPAGM